jgi:branched-chain amino acid transport system permease protein
VSERTVNHMSVPHDVAATPLDDTERQAPESAVLTENSRWTRVGRLLPLAVALVLLLIAPLYVDAFWLTLGAFAFASAIGAIGLTVLYGRVGQLSLAHSFFLAVGAYSYIYFASEPTDGAWGLGLPPLGAFFAAVAFSGLVGLLFSPIAGRLKGLGLGVATIALIFIGEHILYNLPELSGGFNGRNVPEFTIGGFALVGSEPEIVVAGVPLGRPERLWLLCGLVLIVVTVFTTKVLHSRIGRAYIAVRDGETQASALGVNVSRTRASGFMFSSVLAGIAGILLAVAFRRVVPDYWTLLLSLQYIAMVVLGGLGSIRGAIVGAAFVSAVPLLLQRYGEGIGLSAAPGTSFPPSVVAQLVFGALIIVVLLVEPKGLARIAQRFSDTVRRRATASGKRRGTAPENG